MIKPAFKERSVKIENDSMVPKYEQVKKHLLSYIDEMPPEEDYLPYEYELEELFMVSKRTIRRALRDLRDEGIIETVRNRGSKVNKEQLVDNGVSSSFSGPFLKNQVIGSVICSDQPGEARTGYFPWRITEELEKAAGLAGATVQVHNLREEKWRDHDVVIAALKASGVKWTFYYPHSNHQPGILLKKMMDNDIRPAIYLQDINAINEIAIDLYPEVDWVVINNLHGIYRILQREFCDIDFIAYVGSKNEEYWERPRLEVFQRFAREQAIPFEEVLNVLDEMDSGPILDHDVALGQRRNIGFVGAEKLLDTLRQYQNPLIVGANDSYAVGILDCFAENQIKIPEEVKVIGYDNRNDAMENNLSSFDNNCEMVGKCLFDFCQKFYTGKIPEGDFSSGRTIYSKFVKRRSTGN